MTRFTWRDWAFALKVCGAALLALGLALWIDLPRPYWAVTTVFITSQPLAGATRSRAVYRVYGTLLGAIAAVILVPALVNAPELLTLALALWVGGCLYLSLLDRTAKSFILVTAGFSAGFVGFPIVGDPGTIFDVAVTRVEEITLGILCAALVASIVLPQSAAPVLKARLEQWFRDACAWGSAVFGRIRQAGGHAQRLRLASDAIAFDALATPLRYDISGAERSVAAMATLRQHMLMFLPIVTSIADRIEALERIQALPAKVRQLLDDMAAWLGSGSTDPDVADRLRHAAADIDPKFGLKPNWADLLVASLAARLKDFIDLRQDARALQKHIIDGTPVREALAFRYTANARAIRHRDQGMALLSAVAAVLAIVLAGAIWIATGWPDGGAAPMLAAVGCSLFAAQDDPAPQIMNLANGGLIGTLGATVYLFGILPMATGFEMLAIALTPALLFCGLLMTQPRTALIGLGAGIVGFTLLALQNSYSGEFASFANSAIAALFGIWIAAIVTRLVRSVGGAWTARRLWRVNRYSLAAAASGNGAADSLELAAVMLDRVGLIAPRLTALPPDDAEWTADLVVDVRIGINLVALRRIRSGVTGDQADEFDRLMAALSQHFQGGAIHPPATLLASIDRCIDRFAADRECSVRRAAMLGLTDLRRGLFPNATPYQFGEAGDSGAGLAA